MGLFKKKKKVYTSSSVYNLAGDIKDRPNILKTTILAQAINNSHSGYSDAIGHSYLFGQGMKMRQFAKWLDKNNYRGATGASAPRIKFESITTAAMEGLQTELRYLLGSKIHIKEVDTGFGELEWWGDAYISENRPDLIDRNYTVDMEDGQTMATINVYADDDDIFEFPLEIISFFPDGYVPENEYLYVGYIDEIGRVEGATTGYPKYSVPELSNVDGWELVSTEEEPITLTLRGYKEVSVSYSDGSPTEFYVEEISTTTPTAANTVIGNVKREPVPSENNQLVERVTTRNQYTNKVVKYSEETLVTTEGPDIDGLVVTTSTTTYTAYIGEEYAEQDSVREDLVNEWTLPKLFYYVKGSGNSYLDSFFTIGTETGQYYPIMPVKYGSFISNSAHSHVYNLNKAGYKKLTGKKKAYDEMLTAIRKNSGIGDVNYIYNMFGASINSRDNAARRYIFDYFDNFYTTNSNSLDDFNDYLDKVELVKQSVQDWKNWFEAQKDIDNPKYGTPQPTVISYPSMPGYSFVMRNNFSFQYTISWSGVRVVEGAGLHEPNARTGTVTIKRGARLSISFPTIDSEVNASPVGSNDADSISITLQTSNDTWRQLTVVGLRSFNHIHKGKGESLSGYSELGRSEESGLIIPLNEAAFKEMGLIKGTQFTTANSYLIFNSYKVVKKKWYQTGAFKIILVIVVIVVSIVFTPAAGAGVSGVFGSAGAAGAAIGFASGSVAAIVAGSIANIVAAIVVTKVITTVAVSIFGEKVGLIIGTVLSIAALNVGTSLANGQGWASNFSEMMNPVNLLKLTDSVSQTFINDINTKTKKLTHETEALITEYEKEAKRIEDLYELNFGVGNGIDIKAITELASKFEYRKEDSDAFLSRTLMTGSDIAQLSQDMIDKFASMTTALILE